MGRYHIPNLARGWDFFESANRLGVSSIQKRFRKVRCAFPELFIAIPHTPIQKIIDYFSIERKCFFKRMPMKNKVVFLKGIKIVCCFLFLCLVCPAQTFPPFTVDVCDTGSKGYYFITPANTGNSAISQHMILDNKGRIVYYNRLTAYGTDDFKIQPNGLMSYSYGNQFMLMDSAFHIVDSVSCKNGIHTDAHDMQILPNGHFLLLGYEFVTMNLSSYHIFNHNGSPGAVNAIVRCGVIQEQDANKNVVFEWHTKDHFSFGDVDPVFMSGPLHVDWTHCNSVCLDNDGNILLSCRHLDEITKINRSDSSIIWRMGGNANQFTFLNDTAKFIGQHDIRRIANGHITINDNGRANPFHPASAKEYQLDENLLTATLVWSYTENPASYSIAMGNVTRLPNGNTVVDNGNTPLEDHMFNVVTPSGAKVFQVTFQDTLRTYRAFNYLTLPWQLTRPQISCYMVGPQLYLDAGSGYGSYLWSTGDTTETIPVSAADTFSVFVPTPTGGLISSDYLVVANPSTYCVATSIENNSVSNGFSIFPNPANTQLTIDFPNAVNGKVTVEIYNCIGEKIVSSQISPVADQIRLSVSDLPAGIYFVKLNGVGKRFVKI